MDNQKETPLPTPYPFAIFLNDMKIYFLNKNSSGEKKIIFGGKF